jgi:hypothetical protein
MGGLCWILASVRPVGCFLFSLLCFSITLNSNSNSNFTLKKLSRLSLMRADR